MVSLRADLINHHSHHCCHYHHHHTAVVVIIIIIIIIIIITLLLSSSSSLLLLLSSSSSSHCCCHHHHHHHRCHQQHAAVVIIIIIITAVHLLSSPWWISPRNWPFSVCFSFCIAIMSWDSSTRYPPFLKIRTLPYLSKFRDPPHCWLHSDFGRFNNNSPGSWSSCRFVIGTILVDVVPNAPFLELSRLRY